MSKRRYIITTVDGERIPFSLDDAFNNFESHQFKGTELGYTIREEIDLILDMGINTVLHFYEDRAKEFPCLIKRVG